jgi:hypothetical protein
MVIDAAGEIRLWMVVEGLEGAEAEAERESP